MKSLKMLAPLTGLALLAACSGGADDKAASNIEAASENKAEQIEQQAENATTEQQEDQLERQAQNVADKGEEASDRADDKDDASIENQTKAEINTTR